MNVIQCASCVSNIPQAVGLVLNLDDFPKGGLFLSPQRDAGGVK